MSVFDQQFAGASEHLMFNFSDEISYTPPGASAVATDGIPAIVGEETTTDRLHKDGLRFVTEREFLLVVTPDSPNFCGFLDPNQAHLQTGEPILLPHGKVAFEGVVYVIRGIRAGQVGGMIALATERTEMVLKASDSYKPRRGNGVR